MVCFQAMTTLKPHDTTLFFDLDLSTGWQAGFIFLKEKWAKWVVL